MILLGMWGRNFGKNGMAAFPANAWKWYADNVAQWAAWFDGLQAPPAALTASGSAPNGDGYGVRIYRILDGTYWGSKSELVELRATTKKRGKKLWGDFPWRQLNGENAGEPGVFPLHGTGKFAGDTSPSWFQFFGQPGEKLPPKGTPASELVNYFVPQDTIPSTDGDEPDGRAQSMQHCIPSGIVVENIIDALGYWQDDIGYDGGRIDEGKALYLHGLAEIVASQPGMTFYAEVMFGNVHDLWEWACNSPMNSKVAVEDYGWYWHLQSACNGYDFRLLHKDGFYGFFEDFSNLSILFFGNPDVTSSRGVNNSISEQIVFNLGLAAAITIPLPAKAVIVDAQAYWPASKTFPGCYGLQGLINNICWFARTFAIGDWAVRWLDQDIFAYSRDGNGGEYGWSGGCLIVANINTFTTRYLDLQTMWPEGMWIHNYSATGKGEDYTVGPGGVLYDFEAKNNAYSNGRSYYLLAPGGVS